MTSYGCMHRTIYIEVDYFAFKFTEHPSATLQKLRPDVLAYLQVLLPPERSACAWPEQHKSHNFNSHNALMTSLQELQL